MRCLPDIELLLKGSPAVPAAITVGLLLASPSSVPAQEVPAPVIAPPSVTAPPAPRSGALRLWRVLVVHGIPLLVAIAAALFLLLWIMGASSVQGEGPKLGYTVGLAALFLYPASYQVLIIAWAICRWRKWSLAGLFVQLIWCCLTFFAGAMAYAIVELQPYLQF